MNRRVRNNSTAVIAGGVVVAIMIVALFGALFYSFGTESNVTFTVKRLERVTQSSSDGSQGVSSKYLIFTDKETFENTDAPLHGKFNSSDLYGKLTVGTTYNCKVNGLRIPLFSQYRNLLECNVR